MVCKAEKEPELCDGWLIPGRQSPQVSRHINKKQGHASGKQGHLQKYKRNLENKKGLGMQVPVKMGSLLVWIV